MKRTSPHLYIYNRKLFPKKFIHIKKYEFYIDRENFYYELSRGRYTDAIATTNYESVNNIIKAFKLEHFYLLEIEQDLFDMERKLIKEGHLADSILLELSEHFKLDYRRLVYLLNRIDAKFYVADILLDGKLPPRLFRNKFKNVCKSNS